MTNSEPLILGIDPGSRCTGYAIIAAAKGEPRLITHGFIRCQHQALSERLYHIHQQLSDIIAQHQPHEAAIEQVFTCINPQSALKLGQARGAALSATAKYALPVEEYSPRQIKQAVVGYGGASKVQVQHMVKSLLKLNDTPQSDAADALAIAICHAHQRRLPQLLQQARQQT